MRWSKSEQEDQMVEVKQQRTESETIARRQRNSGDAQHADTVVKGERTPYTNIHRSRNQQYGEGQRGVDIHGRPRGPANNPRDEY
jgi:hypothetical protein